MDVVVCDVDKLLCMFPRGVHRSVFRRTTLYSTAVCEAHTSACVAHSCRQSTLIAVRRREFGDASSLLWVSRAPTTMMLMTNDDDNDNDDGDDDGYSCLRGSAAGEQSICGGG
jgi:hypothetical protein